MATIQIRDVPEDVYEKIRLRARAEGKSIQAYLLDLLTDGASKPTKRELLAQLEAHRRGRPPISIDVEALLADIASGRP
jgi:plasmid stability protein